MSEQGSNHVFDEEIQTNRGVAGLSEHSNRQNLERCSLRKQFI